MKQLFISILTSSVLMACHQDQEPQYSEPAFNNEVTLSILGRTTPAKKFGHSASLSSVECQYSSNENSLKLVAYKFQGTNQVQISESLQIVDHGVNKSLKGQLIPEKNADVPAFIYMASGFSQIEYSENSSCSTDYEIDGHKIKGKLLCASLESESGGKEFVSVEFQCLDQEYLLFEVKKEML